jgi:putative membrane protein
MDIEHRERHELQHTHAHARQRWTVLNATQQQKVVTIAPIGEFKADDPQVIEVPPGSTPESEFSRRRTALSVHRTGLSVERTDLSHQRTALATLRSHLANERTHLAYMRTAIALIGFGITLNRFAIYLIQSATAASTSGGTPALRDTKSVGLGMVILGFTLMIWAVYRFHRTSRDIEERRYHTGRRAMLTASVLFLMLGVMTTFWLFFA